MKTLCLALLIFPLAFSNGDRNILSDDFINEINSKQSLWKAGKNFNGQITKEQIRGLLGVVKRPTNGMPRKIYDPTVHLPQFFDAREQWPECASIREIADQSSCGSCWAVSTANSMSDRVCIASEGKSQLRISARNIMSCCTNYCGYGCQGGSPFYAWLYWETIGYTTGGLYNSSVGCQPYPFAACLHYDYGENSSYPDCPETLYDTPKCTKECDTSEEFVVTYGKETALLQDETSIQNDIIKNGPLVADFYVYEDFIAYKSGIYKKTSGELIGGHAVRIIGWGVENDVKYWLIANSWNEDWGDKGVFKFIRGQDDCGIEDECSSGIPVLD